MPMNQSYVRDVGARISNNILVLASEWRYTIMEDMCMVSLINMDFWRASPGVLDNECRGQFP